MQPEPLNSNVSDEGVYQHSIQVRITPTDRHFSEKIDC
jgi:hypothetical protein